MKKLFILLGFLLLILPSCGNINYDTDDTLTNVEQEDMLYLNIKEEMCHIILDNGKYNLTTRISKIISDFKAALIEQDEESSIIQISTEYADQQFRIPSSKDITLQVMEISCPMDDYRPLDFPKSYRLLITIGVQDEDNIYQIGEVFANINDLDDRLNVSDLLFEADPTYQIIDDYMSFEQIKHNFKYGEDEYEAYVLMLYYTGVPNEYYGVIYEEGFTKEGIAYQFRPVDKGQVYTLSDECEIYGMDPFNTWVKLPEGYAPDYSFYLISEIQLRTAVVRGFMLQLFSCYIVDGKIVLMTTVPSS